MKLQDEIVLFESTGRELEAYRGIIGMRPGDQTVYYGYDGTLDDMDAPLTAAEQHELADHMIAAWQQFKAGINS